LVHKPHNPNLVTRGEMQHIIFPACNLAGFWDFIGTNDV
jgi:hypothetical protein